MDASKIAKIRMQMLLTLDFEQVDSRMVARVKQAIRAASDADLAAAFEASKPSRSFNAAIRDTATAGGASESDVTAIVGALAYNGVA
jgi:hypothetical protein